MTAPLHNLWMISFEPYFDFPPFQRTDMPRVPYCLRLELYTDSVFWYEPFGIFPVFSYQIPKGNSVGKFGILKLAGAVYTHMVTTHRRLLSARILPVTLLQCVGGGFSS